LFLCRIPIYPFNDVEAMSYLYDPDPARKRRGRGLPARALKLAWRLVRGRRPAGARVRRVRARFDPDFDPDPVLRRRRVGVTLRGLLPKIALWGVGILAGAATEKNVWEFLKSQGLDGALQFKNVRGETKYPATNLTQGIIGSGVAFAGGAVGRMAGRRWGPLVGGVVKHVGVGYALYGFGKVAMKALGLNHGDESVRSASSTTQAVNPFVNPYNPEPIPLR
jgi:hypothetical protein